MRIKLLALLFFLFGIGWLLVSPKVSAQENPEDTAKKHGISFPIAELGNCKDYTECRNYCEDPVNKNSCISFAKSKGFYKDEGAKPSEQVLQKARQVLSCDSVSSCKSLCENPQNYDKCHSFAQNAGISGGYKEDPRSRVLLERAREALGCESYDTCKNFCENPANRDKCAQFARSVGLNGGYEYRGPGGCTSEETCRTFCSDPANTEVCRQYSQHRGEDTTNFDPQAECKKYPGCTWAGNYCQCNSTDQGNLERQRSQCASYPGCSWAGTRCNCSGGGGGTSPTPSYGDAPKGDYSCGQAALAVGCYTVDKTCKCPSSFPTGGTNGSGMSRESQEAGCKSGGGTCAWNGDMCNCQGYHAPSSTSAPSQTQSPSQPQPQATTDPATACAQTSGCSWTGSTCQCTSQPVQGIETIASWFQQAIYYIESLFGK